MVVDIGLSSVTCPSVVRSVVISARRITIEHYVEIGAADSDFALRSSIGAPLKTWYTVISHRLRHQTTAVVNIVRPSPYRRCCQQSSTVETCWSHSSSVVLPTPLVWRKSRTRGEPPFYCSADMLVYFRLLCLKTFMLQYLERRYASKAIRVVGSAFKIASSVCSLKPLLYKHRSRFMTRRFKIRRNSWILNICEW